MTKTKKNHFPATLRLGAQHVTAARIRRSHLARQSTQHFFFGPLRWEKRIQAIPRGGGQERTIGRTNALSHEDGTAANFSARRKNDRPCLQIEDIERVAQRLLEARQRALQSEIQQ